MRRASVPRSIATADGIVGGTPFARGKLYKMLSNPLYVGRVRHKADVIRSACRDRG